MRGDFSRPRRFAFHVVACRIRGPVEDCETSYSKADRHPESWRDDGTFGPVLAQAIEFPIGQNQIVLTNSEGFVRLIGSEFQGVYLQDASRSRQAALQQGDFTDHRACRYCCILYATPAGRGADTKKGSGVDAASSRSASKLGQRVARGSFRLVKRMEEEGLLHERPHDDGPACAPC